MFLVQFKCEAGLSGDLKSVVESYEPTRIYTDRSLIILEWDGLTEQDSEVIKESLNNLVVYHHDPDMYHRCCVQVLDKELSTLNQVIYRNANAPLVYFVRVNDTSKLPLDYELRQMMRSERSSEND